MTFTEQKRISLNKKDQSKKGSIDEKALSLVNLINCFPNYYTTSSCSGRVYFYRNGEKKNDVLWIKVSHDLITEDFFDLEANETVFLRVEPFILHVCCENLLSAQDLLKVCQEVFKKSVLINIGKRIIVEIKGSNYLDMPFFYQGNFLYSGNLQFLQQLVNEKLSKNFERIQKLEEKIKQKFNVVS